MATVTISPPTPSPRRIYAFTALLSALILTGSWLFNHYLVRLPSGRTEAGALPILGAVKGDFQATDAARGSVSFSELSGHVTACSYLFTKCPHGCSQVFTCMRELRDEFGARPDFRLASVAVLPDLDPPEFLRQFATSQGVPPTDRWLFMSGGAREPVWKFMHESLGLEQTRETPESERLSQCDYCEHDLRIVLIDRHRRIRGYYQVMNPDPGTRELVKAKLLRQTRQLLDSSE